MLLAGGKTQGEDGGTDIRAERRKMARVEVTRMQMACIRKRQSGRGKKRGRGGGLLEAETRRSDERGREHIAEEKRNGDSGIAVKQGEVIRG